MSRFKFPFGFAYVLLEISRTTGSNKVIRSYSKFYWKTAGFKFGVRKVSLRESGFTRSPEKHRPRLYAFSSLPLDRIKHSLKAYGKELHFKRDSTSTITPVPPRTTNVSDTTFWSVLSAAFDVSSNNFGSAKMVLLNIFEALDYWLFKNNGPFESMRAECSFFGWDTFGTPWLSFTLSHFLFSSASSVTILEESICSPWYRQQYCDTAREKVSLFRVTVHCSLWCCILRGLCTIPSRPSCR